MWEYKDENEEFDEERPGRRGDERCGPGDWSSLGDAIGGSFAASFGPARRGPRGPRGSGEGPRGPRGQGGQGGQGGPRGPQGRRRRGPGGPGFGGPGFGGPGGGRGGQPVPPWVAQMLGFEPPRRRGPAGPKVRRGDVRSAILDVLASGPHNGYQVINEIAERSHGQWKPSPGSVYPTIAQLEDEGLVIADESLGRRALTLTDEGRAYVSEHAAELAAVWAPFAPPEDEAQGALPEIGQVMNALWQIVTTGTDAQRAKALEVLSDTRRRLYQILADGDAKQGDASEQIESEDVEGDDEGER